MPGLRGDKPTPSIDSFPYMTRCPSEVTGAEHSHWGGLINHLPPAKLAGGTSRLLALSIVLDSPDHRAIERNTLDQCIYMGTGCEAQVL